jgi:hypothetical protein
MTRVPTRQAALVGAAAGLGLWCTLATLDVADVAGRTARIAMLPSWWALLLAVGACALGAVVVVAGVARASRAPRADAGGRALDVLRPAAAASLLVLPYLPWLADWLPALVLLAGPGAWLWWGLVAGQMTVALVGHIVRWRSAVLQGSVAGGVAESATAKQRDLTPTPPRRDLTPPEPQRRRWTTGIALASVVLSGTVASQFIRTPLFPGGDEPHYLVIAQSLWRDGDLRIENNHQRRDYDEYFHRDLAPHYLTRGVDREIYSIHPVGMPVLMAPVYAVGGYELVVTAFVFLAAAALTLAWRLAWAVTGSAAAATFGWATLAAGVPWLFNTFTIYPEIPAATATLAAFTATSGWRAGRDWTPPAALHAGRFVAAGVAIGLLPWLSTKYVVMGAALGVITLARLWLPWPADGDVGRRALVRTLAVGLPSAISLVAWFSFFNWIWGTYSPSAPYGAQRETRLAYLPQGGPGLLLDQEYGVMLAAPALLLALPGVVRLLRRRDGARRVTVELLATFAGLLGVVGAFHIWWGGSAVVGRPVVAALPLLVVPVAAQWQAAQSAPWRRAAHFALLWIGMGMSVLVALAQNGLLLVAGRDGSWQVLEYLAPSSNVWTLLPSFLRQSPGQAAVMAAVWVAALLAAGTLMGAWRRPATYGRSAASSAVVSVAAVAAVSGLVAATLPPSTAPQQVEGRPRVRMLDTFDAPRRPTAILYTPFTLMDADAVPGLFPIRVNAAGATSITRDTGLFGQRLSLPAGTYGVDLVFPPGAPAVDGAIALQVGRAGPPYQSWEIALTPPGTWGRRFELPVDAGFVGFKVTDDVAAAGPAIRVTPQRIVPASSRRSSRNVLASARYDDVQVFVHGEDAWPERDGVWMRGRSAAELTVRTDTERPLVLDVRAGAVPVRVTVDAGGVVRVVSLEAGQSETVTLPAASGPRPLRVTTSDGFVPAEVEPGSRDRRLLGSWVTFR